MFKLLSIAGSDPSGGAGIQMDLKVFSVLGAYGMAVPTALTVQNTQGVFKVEAVSTALVIEQVEKVIEDIKVDGIKIGMLGNTNLAKELKKILRSFEGPVVMDPVLKSTTGTPLTRGDFKALLELAKYCTVITPNIKEVLQLTGTNSLEEGVKVLRESSLNTAIIVTGADEGKETVTDWIFEAGKRPQRFCHTKVKLSNETHGTGCAFSSALLYYLLNTQDLTTAYLKARDFVVTGLKNAFKVGKGIVPVRPEANTERDAQRYRVIKNLSEAFDRLQQLPKMHKLIPEVQSNLAEAIEKALDISDVAAFPGRIVRFKNGIKTLGCPEFGASNHVARIILTAMKYDPQKRACMNIRYRREWIERLMKHFVVSSFDRREEPEELKKREGKTLDWGTQVAIEKIGTVPDIIYDEGDVGKEPMIRVLGNDALDVVNKIHRILKIIAP